MLYPLHIHTEFFIFRKCILCVCACLSMYMPCGVGAHEDQKRALGFLPISPAPIYNSFFIFIFVDGHLGGFHTLTIVDDAVIK